MVIIFELTGKKIGYAGVVALSEALKTNVILSKIDLSGKSQGYIEDEPLAMKTPEKTENEIGTEGTKVLCEELKVDKALKELALQSKKDR